MFYNLDEYQDIQWRIVNVRLCISISPFSEKTVPNVYSHDMHHLDGVHRGYASIICRDIRLSHDSSQHYYLY